MRGTIVRIGVSGAGALLAVGLLAAPPAGATGSGKQSKIERSGTACFNTSGKTQGRSHSDPDGMSNGGADKPGCTGGFDADRDGNNGCGNDADREDDNNGHCGRQKAQRDDRVKVERAKVEADRKERCERRKGTTTTSTTAPPTGSVAGAAQDCSCTKNPDGTDSATAMKLQAAGSAPDTAVLAAALSVPPAEASPTTTTTAAVPDMASVAGVEAAAAAVEPQTEVLGQTLERPGVLARTGAGVGGLALLGGLLCGGGRLAVLARRFLRID